MKILLVLTHLCVTLASAQIITSAQQNSVKGIEMLLEENEVSDTVSEVQSDSVLYSITLKDEQVLTGYIHSYGDSTVTIKMVFGGLIVLDNIVIESIEKDERIQKRGKGALWHDDPNKTRYLYSPSAFMMKSGEISFSQKELLFSSVGYGITDYFNIQAGAAIPFWFAEDGFNWILAGKLGTQLWEYLHISGGMQAFVIDELKNAIGLPFATVTIGDEDRNFSFNGTLPIKLGDDSSDFGDLKSYSFSGKVRVSKRVAFVSESWLLLNGDDDIPFITSIAIRILGKNLSTDIGAVIIEGLDFPLPWLDVTYHW